MSEIDDYAAEFDAKKAEIRAAGRGCIVDAHDHTLRHRIELEASDEVGCFHCCEVYSPSEIDQWIDNDDCALCPRCGVDSVIGSASGFPVTDKSFLKEMNEFWFNGPD